MNNLDKLKEELKNDVQGFYDDYLDVEPNQIDSITPEYIAKKINGDCTICLCYGCRYFTNNYIDENKGFKKDECYSYIKNYFSREFNPNTDLCQCPTCKERRGEDVKLYNWKLSYNNIEYIIKEYNLPEAKSQAINNGIFNVKDYPYIRGELIEE